jgi:hypothetical protein
MAKELPHSNSETEIESENTKFKSPRIRSSAYPSYDIEYCVEFTKKFHQNFGNSNYIQREEIAKVLKISVGHIQTQLSSSVQYGTVEMKTKSGYKPSLSFLKIYKPISEDERREALIDCLLKPDLYKKLLLQFKDSTVPTASALATILFRNHNIAEAASESAAEIFIKNLNDLSLLDNENNLLLNRDISDLEESQTGSPKEEPAKNHTGAKQPQVKIIRKQEHHQFNEEQIHPETYPIPIPLKGNRVATLIIPKDIQNEDLDKIVRFIDALRE